MPVSHDPLTVVEARCDNDQIAGCWADFYRSWLGSVVCGDHPDKQTLRAALDRGRGNSKNAVAGLQQEMCIDGFPRPQLVLVIGEHCFESNRSAGLVDRVVDKKKRPGADGLA